MFSPDKQQRLLYISDLTNNHIWFLNREDGKVVGQMGNPMGENGGQFYGLHMIAVDSKAKHIYTGEVFRRRTRLALPPREVSTCAYQARCSAPENAAGSRMYAYFHESIACLGSDPGRKSSISNRTPLGSIISRNTSSS